MNERLYAYLFVLFVVMMPHWAIAQLPSVAFFYADNPPMNELRAFDWVVVEPAHLPDPKPYQHQESEIFAYVSLGEVTRDKHYFSAMPNAWLKGRNEGWDSYVIDQTSPGWAMFVVDQIVEPLWQAGYRGFFLDTLDSFYRIAHDETARAAQIAGLVSVIAAIKTKHPDAKLIFNRGFELLPATHQWAAAVAFESWLRGYDADKKRYYAVPQADRDWLSGQLDQVRAYQLPIIAIDYVPSVDREAARSVAQQLKSVGFIPWVSDPHLDRLGVGSIEVVPRRILMVASDVNDEFDLLFSPAVSHITAILNAMGYAVDYTSTQNLLSERAILGRYAGVVVSTSTPTTYDQGQILANWLTQVKQLQIPLVLMGDLSYVRQNRALATTLGLLMGNAITASRLEVSQQSPQVGYEAQPLLDRLEFYPMHLTDAHQSWLEISDKNQSTQTAVAITSWGGFAIAPHIFVNIESQSQGDFWVIDPFAFFEQGLKLQPMPLPDTTTDMGRRLLMVHHDGDGFASRADLPGNPYAGEVLLENIVKRYPTLPMTISIIEGEVGPKGLYAQDSQKLESIAQAIYRQPNVEMASHTFSHPFSWSVISGARSYSSLYEDYNLPIPNYQPNLSREIQGSIDYMNQRLAPTGKRVKMINWTGDCNPGIEAFKLVDQAGIVSVNGGDTTITNSANSMTRIGAVGINKGAYFQVFAPNQNENVYTHNWSGPYYGFSHALETYQLTDSPRRIKPVDVYFHTYALSKKASMRALVGVLDWAVKQPYYPIYMSDYVRKAQDFNKIVVARTDDGWRIRGLDALKEVRIPQTMGFPDLSNQQVIGFNDVNDQRYIHVSGDQLDLSLRNHKPLQGYIESANGRVTHFMRTATGIKFTLLSHQKPVYVLQSGARNQENCVVKVNNNNASYSSANHKQTIKSHPAIEIETICRP